MNLDWTNLVSVDSIQPGHSLSVVAVHAITQSGQSRSHNIHALKI